MSKYVDYDGLDHFYDNIADRPVQAFDTVADMQAATYLEAGMTCHTNGNATVGDGGAAYYMVGTSGDIALQGGLYAQDIMSAYVAKSLVGRPIETEFVFNVPKDFAANLQGCACDGTYIYLYYDGNTFSTVQKVAIADGSLVKKQQFDEYLGHGNSFNYDSRTGMLVVYSSDRCVTVLDTDLNVISIARDSGANTYPYSQFAMNADFGVANISASNSFVLYQRITADLYSAYKTVEIPMNRYMYNALQDSVIQNDTYFALVGLGSTLHYLVMFGVTGTYLGYYQLMLGESEPQGICCDSTYMYVINTNGNVYRFALALFPDGINVSARLNLPLENVICPMAKDFYPSFVTNRSDLEDTYFHTYRDIQTRAPRLNKIPTLNYYSMPNARANLVGDRGAIIETVANGALRIRSRIWATPYDVSITYRISSDRSYYLMELYDIFEGATRKARLVMSTTATTQEREALIDTFVTDCSALSIVPKCILLGYETLGYPMSNFLVISSTSS